MSILGHGCRGHLTPVQMHDTCTIARSPKLTHPRFCKLWLISTKFISSAFCLQLHWGPPKSKQKTERSWLNLGVKQTLKRGRRRSREPPMTARARCAAPSLVVRPWSKRLSPGCLERLLHVCVSRCFQYNLYATYHGISACCFLVWNVVFSKRCVMELAGC